MFICLLVNLSVSKVFYQNGKLGRFLCLAENKFSLQNSIDEPLRVNYTFSQYLILSDSNFISYIEDITWPAGIRILSSSAESISHE